MAKHYEDVWIEAEKVSSELFEQNDCSLVANKLYEDTKLLTSMMGDDADDTQPNAEAMAELMGEMLFNMAHICKKYDINSWTALESAMNGFKIDLLDSTLG